MISEKTSSFLLACSKNSEILFCTCAGTFNAWYIISTSDIFVFETQKTCLNTACIIVCLHVYNTQDKIPFSTKRGMDRSTVLILLNLSLIISAAYFSYDIILVMNQVFISCYKQAIILRDIFLGCDNQCQGIKFEVLEVGVLGVNKVFAMTAHFTHYLCLSS